MDLKKFQGAMMGTFVGDALGMPVEGLTQGEILSTYGHDLREMEGSPERNNKPGTYTDDTQLMIGLAEALISSGKVDCSVIASRFAKNFEFKRGYGPGTISVLGQIRAHVRWDEPAKELFEGAGSFGNGAAMRIAPLACIMYDRPKRIRGAAENCSRITHTHLLGVEGSVLQAWAVALAIASDPEKGIEQIEFVDKLLDVTDIPEYITALTAIRDFLTRGDPPIVDEVVRVLGNDVRAHSSVPAAIYSFLKNWDSFEETVIYGVNLGGDTDTIGAMAGAIAGGFHGIDAIPMRWLSVLENEKKGRDYVMDLAKRLWDKKQISTF